ncbi:MAG: hypothetical protein SGI96_15070 [Bacteroidota bacterium]|nr:hypothetical protein [Chitinophagaceae bacterium]MDZ4809570.1 hypothetical protein [Bacteroidota bacterium]
MKQFDISLKNEKIKPYNRLSWLIIIIHIIVFLYLSFFSNDRIIRVSAIASLVLLAFCFFLKLYFKKTKWAFGFHPFFLFLMVGWITMGKYWLAAIPFIFDILFSITVRKFSVEISVDKIIYPSFPKKNINWTELNNIILKDGLLTINFKNNKFIQQFVDETKTVVNEQEFNDFCHQQLNK